MTGIQSFVPADVADRVVAADTADARERGAAVVALQIRNSRIFSIWCWLLVTISLSITGLLHSWLPIVISTVLLTMLYIYLFVVMAYKIARTGMLQEYQAAYKRLYYRDQEFQRRVIELLARRR